MESEEDGVILDVFEVVVSLEAGPTPVDGYARFGPVVVTNIGVDVRRYSLTHEESGMRCGPLFSDGLLACEAARHIVQELGVEFFVPNMTDGGAKRRRVHELCQPFLDQEAAA